MKKRKLSERSAITLQDLNIDLYSPVKIVLIGCGGTGSLLLSALARLNDMMIRTNIGSLFVSVIDDDVFEEHNVCKQTCSSSDVGRNKAEVCVERINEFYGFAWAYSISRYPYMNKNVMQRYDIFISAVDSIETRLNLFKKTTRPIIDIGNGKDYGQIIMSCYDEKIFLPSTEDLFQISKKPDDNTPSCSMIESLEQQSLFINSVAAMFAANMLSDLFVNRYLEYNQIYFSLNPLNVKSKLEVYENHNRKK